MMDAAPRSRRLAWILVPVALLVAGAAYFWFRPAVKEPPAIDMSKLDPGVARAVETARDAVRADTTSAAAWGDLGLVLFAHDLYPESLPCFEEAERLDPSSPQWPYFQALVYILGNESRALECLDRVIERGGGQIAPRVRRAETLLSLEKWDEARKALDEIQHRRADHPRVVLGQARLAARDGDWDRCATLLTPLTQDPTSRRAARTLLAEVAARRGDPEGAAVHQAALADLPRDIPWEDPYLDSARKKSVGLFQRLEWGAQLNAQGRYDEAEKVALEILKTNPQLDEAHWLLARIYLAAGDSSRSEAAAQKGIDVAPRVSAGHFLLGSARLLKRNAMGAEAAFRKAIEYQPDYAEAHYLAGECRRQQRDPKGATDDYRAAIRFRPNLVEAHRALGAALLESGDAVAARAHLQDALRLRPGDPEATRLLATTGNR